MSSPKEFRIDAVYPEPLSRLRRGHGMSTGDTPSAASYRRAVKKQRNHGNAGAGRFRTQPITFQEIKEVDEDNIVEPEVDNLRGSVGTFASSSSFKSETDLKASFQLFYQSIKSGNDDDITGLDIVTDITNVDKQQERPSMQSPLSNSNPHQLPSAPIPISLHARSRQSF